MENLFLWESMRVDGVAEYRYCTRTAMRNEARQRKDHSPLSPRARCTRNWCFIPECNVNFTSDSGTLSDEPSNSQSVNEGLPLTSSIVTFPSLTSKGARIDPNFVVLGKDFSPPRTMARYVFLIVCAWNCWEIDRAYALFFARRRAPVVNFA